MTALEKWKNDFKEFISELSIPRDDYKGIMEYINEVPNEALEQEPCEDWYDVPSDEMTLEQARQAVKDLRKKLAEDLEKNRENLINQKATTCRHGGHCEWVACDKCNHYEPDALSQQPCDDCISRHDALNCVTSNEFRYKIVEDIKTLPSVTPKEKTGRWISIGIQGEIDGQIVRAFTCSKCGAISIFRVSNRNIVNGDLCPNCGAKMIKSEDKEIENE